MTAAPGAQPPKAKKQRHERPLLEELPTNGHPGNSKFARALGSTDFQTREKGLNALKSFLLRKNDMKEEEMMKIWKGLFYCFWHSDKVPVQAELADRLAAMLTQLSEQSAYLYFTCFMATMRREWFGIDRLRLDKFLMLIRKFINRMLGCLKAAKWRPDLVQRYTSYLHHHVVLPSDTLPAAGLAYHCADILLDELRLVAEDKPVPGEALAALLEPFVAALQIGDQTVLNRIGEGLFDSLLSELGSPTDDSPFLQKLDTAALAAKLFELGAAPETRARNRQVLYDLSGSLERLQRKRQRIDTGAQAGPSSAGDAEGKAKKKGKKARVAEVAAAAQAAQAAANRVSATEPAEKAAAPTMKRKAAEVEPEDVQQPQQDGADQKQAKVKSALKKKKKRHGAEDGDEEAAPEAVPVEAVAKASGPAAGKQIPVAAAAPSPRVPTSGMKAALRAAVAKVGQPEELKPAKADKAATKASQQVGLEAQANGHAAASTGGAATPSPKRSALGKRAMPGSAVKVASQAEEGAKAAAASKTPVQVNAGTVRKKAVTSAKKGRVVINLKKNLYFEHGGPIPDPDIRTPPPARAKGGILKTTAKTCPPKVSASHGATAAAKHNQQQQQQQPQTRVLPKNTRRASAALFF